MLDLSSLINVGSMRLTGPLKGFCFLVDIGSIFEAFVDVTGALYGFSPAAPSLVWLCCPGAGVTGAEGTFMLSGH